MAASDCSFIHACTMDVKHVAENYGDDPTPFMPPPNSNRAIMKKCDNDLKQAQFKAYKKEIKSLVDAGTSLINVPNENDNAIPTMEMNQVKLQSDERLNKLKCCIIICGDL